LDWIEYLSILFIDFDKRMSKIGKKPVVIPAGVEVQLNGNHIQVKGPKGTLEWDIPAAVTAKIE
jgi:large subunit ribosomal protein L6